MVPRPCFPPQGASVVSRAVRALHSSLLRRLPLSILFALLFCGWAPALAGAAPLPLGKAASGTPELALSFEEAAVVASGLTPDGEALVFATGRVPLRYASRVHHWNVVEVADGLGELRFEVPDGVPLQSIWTVVDLTTGAFRLSAAPGLGVEAQRLPPGVLRAGSAGQLDRFAPGLAEGRVLLVRPGTGAWTGHLADGADGDRDGQFDGGFEAAVETLEPAGTLTPEAPEEVLPRDVLVVLDPQQLRIFTLTLGPPA